MLSKRRRIVRCDSGRREILVATPAITGIKAAIPALIKAIDAPFRAPLLIRSATSRPAPSPIATCEKATTPDTGRFSPNFSRDNCDMRIEAREEVWDFQPEMKRALGIDLGDARIGVALSDELGFLAHPLQTLAVKEGNVPGRIAAIAREKSASTIVVGMPRNMDGTFGPAAAKARAFIEQLATVAPCPVVPWDERLSTVAAQRNLQEAGRKARDQKDIIDQAAAQIILQSWLDAQST